MTYRPIDFAAWAVKAAKYMEDMGHVDYQNPVSRETLAQVCDFPECQWYRVKDYLLAQGYHLGVKPGRNGGFFLGEHGVQATHLVLTEKYVESRLDTSQHQEEHLKRLPGWGEILQFARERAQYDLSLGAKRIREKTRQLALPIPNDDDDTGAAAS